MTFTKESVVPVHNHIIKKSRYSLQDIKHQKRCDTSGSTSIQKENGQFSVMVCTMHFKRNSLIAYCSLLQMLALWLASWSSTCYNRGIRTNGRFTVYAMSITGKREAHNTKVSSCSLYSTRMRFLSSSAAAFFTASAGVIGFVGGNEECLAAPISNDNPRYIDKELQMKYGESPGMIIND